jgi:hypothetical protein
MDGERRTPARSAVEASDGPGTFPPQDNCFCVSSEILNESKWTNRRLLLFTARIKVWEKNAMEYSRDKVDEMTLALLSLTMFSDGSVTRAWKGHAWEVLDRLHEKGYICDPKGKAKSVVMTEEGIRQARELFARHFVRVPIPDCKLSNMPL